EKVSITSSVEVKAENQRTFELLINLKEVKDKVSIHLKEDTILSYDNHVFTLYHGPSGYGRSERQIEVEDLKMIHVIADTTSLEIFLNDGEYVMSSRVYPKKEKETILIEGTSQLTLTKWDLEI
ncbi:MAG: GH32 C-terminal domain-containing protein, partial [Alkalibacterium sp.]